MAHGSSYPWQVEVAYPWVFLPMGFVAWVIPMTQSYGVCCRVIFDQGAGESLPRWASSPGHLAAAGR